MNDGVDAGRTQDLEYIDAFGDGAGAEAVDMAGDEVVGMSVVGTEHHLVWIVVQQVDERIEIPGGAAFADQDLHPGLELVERFFGSDTFMIRADSRADVLPGLFAAEAGRVAVDGFADALGGVDLGHDFGVFVEDAGEVHHFAEIFDIVAGEELGYFGGFEGGAGGFETGSGDAAGRAEIEVKRHGIAVADHKFDTWEAADVGDLVGVADGGDGPVDDGQAREFGGDEEGGFDMDMGVDKAGEDIWGIVREQDGRRFGGIGGSRGGQGSDRLDAAGFDGHDGGVYISLEDVY